MTDEVSPHPLAYRVRLRKSMYTWACGLLIASLYGARVTECSGTFPTCHLIGTRVYNYIDVYVQLWKYQRVFIGEFLPARVRLEYVFSQ